MASRGARIGVVGATGALGTEVLTALDASRLRVREIRPIATRASRGLDVEFQGEIYAVVEAAAGGGALRGLDLALLCAPPEASLAFAREALRAEVPAIDLSGAFASVPEVPLWLGDPAASEAAGAPLVAVPEGPALACALVLLPLHAGATLRRVTGTVLEAASAAGRRGLEALHVESVALFNQQEAPEPEVFTRPIAFDCLPGEGDLDEAGRAPREAALARALDRVLGGEVETATTTVHVPAFVGMASALHVATEQPLDAKRAEELLSRARGVELWGESDGPSLRAAAGRDVVLVGRVRADPAAPRDVALWLVADPLRLAATCAARLAVSRLQLH